jgi:hypothetical protein
VKPLRRLIFLLAFTLSFAALASAQDSGPSLGDIARQERARRIAETDASETAGMKPADFRANILLAGSKDAIEKWVLMPAAERPNAGRIRQVTRDKKTYVPFVVSEYPYPTTEKMDLIAHIRFISPTGKVLLESPKFSENVGPDPRSPHTIVLNPVMDITFDSRDVPGVYTLRLTITDHIHNTYAKAEEKIELIEGKVESSEKDEAPAAVH